MFSTDTISFNISNMEPMDTEGQLHINTSVREDPIHFFLMLHSIPLYGICPLLMDMYRYSNYALSQTRQQYFLIHTFLYT